MKTRVLFILLISMFFLYAGLLFAYEFQAANSSDSTAVDPFIRTNTNRPGEYSGIINNDPLNTQVTLPIRYLDPRTVIITTLDNDTLTQGQDYELDGTLGTVTFLSTPPARFNFYTRYLPISLSDTVQFRTERAAISADTLLAGESINIHRQLESRAESSLFRNSTLQRSGYISRGVQVGNNRDVSVESGLHLTLNGNLSSDIEIHALLDDQNLPIQPEGNSRRLEEIDQVYIDLQARRYHGRFGDYRLETNTGRYGTFTRTLEGGLLRHSGPDLEVEIGGAVTRAMFHTMQFAGGDGIQGPYILTGKNGETPILIIGGSEKVWIDGVLMQRGESEDYTIDYNRGELTFTPRRPITSESRIEIDFEYSPEAYPRNLYTASANYTSPSGKYNLSAMIVEESDDSDRPISFDLTSDIRNQLSRMGDSNEPALISSPDSLGANEGDYVRRDTVWTDQATYSYFLFVEPAEDGSPRGEWSVLFTEVGSGEGEYERQYDPVIGLYYYTWEGPGEGSWSPVRHVPMPERRRNSAIALQMNPSRFVRFSADIGVSGYDRNTLSSVDDDDNTGWAQQYQGFFQLPTRGDISPLEVSVSLRNEENTYRSFAREREIEYERRWGADTLATNIGEREYGSRIVFRPHSSTSIQAGYGKLERGDVFVSERVDGIANLQTNRIQLQNTVEFIHSDDNDLSHTSDWLRYRGSATYLWKVWTPGVEAEYEDRDQSYSDTIFTGFRYQRLKTFWGMTPHMGHSGQVSYENRSRDSQQDKNTYSHVYSEDAVLLEWQYAPSAMPFRSEFEASHRIKQYDNLLDSTDVTTNLASMHLSWTPMASALTTDLQYRVSQTLTRTSALIAYQVPAGEGDYIRVGDEYVYDPEIGNYILRSEPTGDAVPTTDVTSVFHMDWSPHRLPGQEVHGNGFGWEDISLETEIEITEATTWDRPEEIIFLNLGSFQTDSTVQGQLSWRQDIYLFRSQREFNLRVRYYAEQRLQNLYLSGAERFSTDSWELRLRRSLSSTLDLESTLEDIRKRKRFARRTYGELYRLDRMKIDLSWRPSRIWRFGLETRGLYDEDISEATLVRGLALKPKVTWSVRQRGRVSADFEALWIASQAESVPFELADGRPKGRNGRANVRFDYRLGESINARATYTARLDQGREPIHIARVEVSAYF